MSAKNFILKIKKFPGTKEQLFEKLKRIPTLVSARIAVFQNQQTEEIETHAVFCLGVPHEIAEVQNHSGIDEETIIDSLDTTDELIDMKNALRSADELCADFQLTRPVQSDTEDTSVHQSGTATANRSQVQNNEESKQDTNLTNFTSSQVQGESSQHVNLSSHLLSVDNTDPKYTDIDNLCSASAVALRQSQRIKDIEEAKKIEETRQQIDIIDYRSETSSHKKKASKKRKAASPLKDESKKKVKKDDLSESNINVLIKRPMNMIASGDWSIFKIEQLFEAKSAGISLLIHHINQYGDNPLEGHMPTKELRKFMKDIIEPEMRRRMNGGDLERPEETTKTKKGSKKNKKKKKTNDNGELGLFGEYVFKLDSTNTKDTKKKGKKNTPKKSKTASNLKKKKSGNDDEAEEVDGEEEEENDDEANDDNYMEVEDDEGPGDMCNSNSEMSEDDADAEDLSFIDNDDDEEDEDYSATKKKTKKKKNDNKNTDIDSAKKKQEKKADEFVTPKPKDQVMSTLAASLDRLKAKQAEDKRVKQMSTESRRAEKAQETLDQLIKSQKEDSKEKPKKKKRTTLTDQGDSDRKMETESIKSRKLNGSQIGEENDEDLASQISSKIDEMTASEKRGRKAKKISAIKANNKAFLQELRNDNLWGGQKLKGLLHEEDENDHLGDGDEDSAVLGGSNASLNSDEIGEDDSAAGMTKKIKKSSGKHLKVKNTVNEDIGQEFENDNGEEEEEEDDDDDEGEEDEEQNAKRFVKYGENMSMEDLLAKHQRTDSTDINLPQDKPVEDGEELYRSPDEITPSEPIQHSNQSSENLMGDEISDHIAMS